MRIARQISQLFFLLLFIFLFLQARFPYDALLPSDLFLRSSPLVALTTFLSSRTLAAKLAIGLAILLLTLPFGRFFCGWICPLGTTLDAAGRLFFRNRRERATHIVRTYRTWKYALLIFIVIAALFSVQLAWFFDPLVLLSRFATVVFYPVFVLFSQGLFDAAFKIEFMQDQVYALYDWAQKWLLPIAQPVVTNGLAILVIFITILALGLVSRRFWCRSLCPLGALLGLCSKYRLLQRKVDSSCTSCGLCQRRCRMAAIGENGLSTNPAECIECGQCVAECPTHSISYGLGLKRRREGKDVDLSRRRILMAGVAGLSFALFLRIPRAHAHGKVIRPPGAINEETFLQKCIRCQACTRICASTGGCLQPSMSETDLQGLWSPIVIARMGYCEYNCTLCGQVCPTGAIQELMLARKQQLKIGRALFDKDVCIPWREHKDCLVCEEHCPLPQKAIRFDVQTVRTGSGETRTVKLPYVVAELCIGCGICETKCPLPGRPGISVTAEGNERVKFVS
ncbi:4Fe-4S binding protein [candidate division KSB1 bacterium]|nr:4Fe-4S binding protein [candidate division KSB1 bacterium]